MVVIRVSLSISLDRCFRVENIVPLPMEHNHHSSSSTLSTLTLGEGDESREVGIDVEVVLMKEYVDSEVGRSDSSAQSVSSS